MSYYPKRIWNELESEVYIESEDRFIRIEDLTEEEFRKYVLWVLGIAHMKRDPAVIESVRAGRRRRR